MNFDKILLKNLLSNGDFFNKVFSILKPKYFKDSSDQKIFNLIKDYFSEYHNIPTITEIAIKVKDISNSDVRKQLAQTIQDVNSEEVITNVKYLCDETIKFVKNALHLEGLQIGAEAYEKKSDELYKKSQMIFEEMTKVSLDENLGLDYDNVDALIEYFSTRNVGILTQHKEINKRLGNGFLPGTLSVILAGQSVGKSLMMCDLISGMLLKGKNVLLVSLEMAETEMMRRIYANTLKIDVNSFNDLSKTDGELENLGRPTITKDSILSAYNNVMMSGTKGKFFVKDFPTGSFSALQLESLVDKFRIEKNIKFDIVFIDYLGIMKSDRVSPSVGLYSYLMSVCEEVRASAKKLNLPIISASQLNRCFDANAIVQTQRGLIKARDLKEGDKVKSHDEYRDFICKTNVEIKKCYKITLKSGKSLVVSAEHRIPTQDGLKSINFGLKVGDMLNSSN